MTTVLVRNLVTFRLNAPGAGGSKLNVVLVFLVRVLGLGGKLLDDGKVHNLVERNLLGDGANPPVEKICGIPGAFEVGRVVLIEEELSVLGVVGGVRVAEHSERFVLRDGVAVRHELGDPLPRRILLELDHGVEDPPHQAFDDIGVVLGKISAGEPNVGNQLVCRRRGDDEPIPLDRLQVVDVRRPAHATGDGLVGVEGSSGLESILSELELHFRRLNTRVDERVQNEEVGGGVLRQHHGFAAQVGDGLHVIADDDTVTTVGPVHLLVDPGHHSRIAT